MSEDVFQPQKKRIDAYDIAKGIGIILVYLGHVPPHLFVRRFIYTFHMPLFFVISGMLFNEKKYNLKEFVVSRAKSLLIPAFVFSCFAYFIGLFSNTVTIPGILIDLPSALWFLPVLFGAELLVFSLWKIVDCMWGRWAITMVLLLLSLALDRHEVLFFWSLSTIPLAASFFALGNLLKNIPLYSNHTINIVGCLLGGTFMILVPLLFTGCTGVHDNHLIMGFWGYLFAIIGVVSTIMLAFEIDYRSNRLKNKLITLGKNSLTIYGLHFTILCALFKMNYLFPIRFLGYLIWISAGVFLTWLGVVLINKNAKWAIGK